jgi:hypothetical protein
VIPQQVATSPSLLNASYTISTRLLYRLPQYRNSDGIIEWNGITILGLTEETAVYFHNQCIKDLIRLSTDPEQVHSQELLAATFILRTDEEIDAPLRESDYDQEVFLKMLGLFFDAQVTQSGFGHELTPSNTSDFLPKKRFNSLSSPQAGNPESYCPDTQAKFFS